MVCFWFRRDLRLTDNAALYRALVSGETVLPVFIFDTEILNALPADDRRVRFIYNQIERLRRELAAMGKTLTVWYGKPLEVWQKIVEKWPISAVYANRDYEPGAIVRDNNVAQMLKSRGIDFQTVKDQVIFEQTEILNGSNLPYTVFTPYKNRWLATLNDFYLKPYPTERYFSALAAIDNEAEMPALEAMGFKTGSDFFPSPVLSDDFLVNYAERRDFPAQEGASKLGVHLRFGTVSIRWAARRALEKSAVFLNELIWRDFYAMILSQFPRVDESAFKPAYNAVPYRNDESDFMRWRDGKTGYPLVDAGMRQLNATGYMHNRARMVVASFLTKHLLIDWRLGESYFAEKLLDFDLSSNNGGWQWAAGSGCDAAPYFRIFNPSEQVKKFDPKFAYIRQWVPEFDTFDYPSPMIDHAFARQRALAAYAVGLDVRKA